MRKGEPDAEAQALSPPLAVPSAIIGPIAVSEGATEGVGPLLVGRLLAVAAAVVEADALQLGLAEAHGEPLLRWEADVLAVEEPERDGEGDADAHTVEEPDREALEETDAHTVEEPDRSGVEEPDTQAVERADAEALQVVVLEREGASDADEHMVGEPDREGLGEADAHAVLVTERSGDGEEKAVDVGAAADGAPPALGVPLREGVSDTEPQPLLEGVAPAVREAPPVPLVGALWVRARLSLRSAVGLEAPEVHADADGESVAPLAVGSREKLPLVERAAVSEREADAQALAEGSREGEGEEEGDTVAEQVGCALRPSAWQDTGHVQGVGDSAPAGQNEPRGHVMGAADTEGQYEPAAHTPHVRSPMRLNVAKIAGYSRPEAGSSATDTSWLLRELADAKPTA